MRTNRKGYILPMTAVYLVIAIILGAGILYLCGLERIGVARRLNREKAFYLAEAGAYRAYAHLSQYGIDWEPEEEAVSLGDGEFLVTIEETSKGLDVVSIGTVNGISETVKLSVEAIGGRGIFADGIFGSHFVYIDGSSQILGYDSRDSSTQDAYVGSNIKIEIPSSGRIFGNAGVAEGGQIVYPAWSPSAITGDKTYDNEERILEPVVIPGQLLNMPYTQYGAPGLSGNYQISDNDFRVAKWPRVASISGGDYKFNDFNLASDAQLTLNGEVRLYILGIFKLEGNCRFILASGATVQIFLGENSTFSIANSVKMNEDGSPADMAIYSASTNLTNLAGTGDAQINAVIYAPASTITIANGTKFIGGIVSNQLRITGDARVYYDIALSELTVPGDPGGSGEGDLILIRWTKPRWASRFE